MMPERDSELDALLGAYALDALGPDERARVERYVAAHPDARAEVDGLRETAAVLALAPVDGIEAPTELWARIADEIGPVEIGPDLAARRTRRSTRWLAPVAAAAAAIAIAIGVVATLDRDDDTPATVAGAFDDALARGAQEITLASGDTTVARIAILDDGTGYLRNDGLEPLSAGEVYQLWALVGDADAPRVISAGVLGPDPDAAAFTVAGPVRGFALTVEEAPGVATSSQEPVAVSV